MDVVGREGRSSGVLVSRVTPEGVEVDLKQLETERKRRGVD